MIAIAGQGEYISSRHLSAVFDSVRVRSDGESRFATDGASPKQLVETLEKHVVASSLRRHHWNQSRFADELGLSRVGLANKSERYGSQTAGSRGAEPWR